MDADAGDTRLESSMGDLPESLRARLRLLEGPAELQRDRPVGDRFENRRDDVQRKVGLRHQIPAALPGQYFSDRAGEIQVNDINPQPAHHGRRLGHDVRFAPHDLSRHRVVGVVESDQPAQKPALYQKLPVEHGFGRAVWCGQGAADQAIGQVTVTGQRGEDYRKADLDLADLQGLKHRAELSHEKRSCQ